MLPVKCFVTHIHKTHFLSYTPNHPSFLTHQNMSLSTKQKYYFTCVAMHVCVCVSRCTNLLMVKNTSGSLTLKLLLLQDALEVLHPLIGVFHVSRQVAVEKANAVTKH